MQTHRPAIRKRRLAVISLVLLMCAVIAGVAMMNNKYYVKRFIKQHDALYVPAKKLAKLKSELLARLGGASHDPAAASAVDDGRKTWSLIVDASKSLGVYEKFWGNLGYESFISGILSSKNRQLFKLMQETIRQGKASNFDAAAFRYIRCHNLFSDGQPPWGEGCGIYNKLDASGQPVYDWAVVDQVFDEILQNGFKPIVEFGFMPDALASIPDRRQRWGKANISPPKDYQAWTKLIFHTVSHLRDLYGSEEISSWYFEVWNEPDLGWLFWIEDPKRKPYGDVKEYHKLYDYTVTAAKAACPSLRVGGPASAGGDIDLLLEHVYLEDRFAMADGHAAIDFVSSHAYGKVGTEFLNTKEKNILSAIRWKIGRAMEHDHPRVRAAMQQLPFLLTETGPSSDDLAFNNTRFSASWFIKLVDGIFCLGEKLGKPYQPREVVYWAGNQVARYFNNQKGIATYLKTENGEKVFKRPLYNAFDILGRLSPKRLEVAGGSTFGDPVHAIATCDGDTSVEIVLYHLDERDRENLQQDSLDIELTVTNLPFENYHVRWYAIDEAHSNSHAIWKAMGRPTRLTREQDERLSQGDDLELMVPAWREHSPQRRFNKSFRMQSNSVALLVLSKTK